MGHDSFEKKKNNENKIQGKSRKGQKNSQFVKLLFHRFVTHCVDILTLSLTIT
jgi:hypothetical protein